MKVRKILFLSIPLFLCLLFSQADNALAAVKCDIKISPDTNIIQSSTVNVTFEVPGLTTYTLKFDGSDLSSGKLKGGTHPFKIGPSLPAGFHELSGKNIDCNILENITGGCKTCALKFFVYSSVGQDCKDCNEGYHYKDSKCCKNFESPECKTSITPVCKPAEIIDYSPGGGASVEACFAIKDKNSDEFKNCDKCFKEGLDKYGKGSWSAFGCIPIAPDKFIAWLLEKAINLVGGIALLLIIFGSFKVITSSGNPEALNDGKEIIFAALAGLLFIILSVVLLKIIGADILKIPGFS